MRKAVPLLVALALATALLAVAPAGASSTDERPVDYFDIDSLHLEAHGAGSDVIVSSHGDEHSSRTRNLTLLGQFGPADAPEMAFPNADVWSLHDHAYVGTWGAGPGLCPGTGVKVIDISDPTDPQLSTVIPSPPNSQANDVKVVPIHTPDFTGDLLAHSNEPCNVGGSFGFELYDVSDPANPEHLASVGEDMAGPVHNLYLFQRGPRAFVLAATPFAEVFGVFGPEPDSDLVIIEVTDPRNPVLVGEWTIGRDAGLAFGSPFFAGIPGVPAGSDCTPPPGTPELCRGDDFPGVVLHDVWANSNGKVAYLSYWDAGLILLDISDPAQPTMIGRGQEVPALGSDEGNLHAAVPARGGNLTLVTDEDFSPLFGSFPWGFLRIFDTSDPANPVEIGQFATENALVSPSPASFTDFSAHNVEVRGNQAYISWYGDGIRVVDFTRPTAPREIASFALEPPSDFWGVHVEGDLILGSDMINGLFILKHVPK